MMENEKKTEIEAKIAELDWDFHEQLMREFIEKQKQAMMKLNQEMQKLKDSVLDPDKIKDKLIKLEI